MGAGSVDIKNEGNLTQFLENLDEKSRALLWYLWWHRHANISELREVIDVSSDFEVLHRLKEVINEKAKKLLGKLIVNFEPSKIDPYTGEKVFFSWWLLDEEDSTLLGENKQLVDIFNEKDNITIIAQLPATVDFTSPEIQFKNSILKIKLKKVEKND